MFRLLFHFALCIPVVTCPAVGHCCVIGGSHATIKSVAACCDHCPHEHGNENPAPSSTTPCRDCFCTGALPIETTTLAVEHDLIDAFGCLPANVTSTADGKPRIAVELPAGHRLYGQAILRSYCAFLL